MRMDLFTRVYIYNLHLHLHSLQGQVFARYYSQFVVTLLSVKVAVRSINLSKTRYRKN